LRNGGFSYEYNDFLFEKIKRTNKLGGNFMEPKIIKTLYSMEVKIIPKQENIPDFDTKAIQIKHIDYYDPPYSSYEADEITEEVISKSSKKYRKDLIYICT
jgi:hypothetical protein